MFRSSDLKVFLAIGVTDMRKHVNGLSILVEEALEENPFSGSLFGFCNRNRDIIKILYWDTNGYCVWYKKLDSGRFPWPKSESDVLELGTRELNWLLDGLSIEQKDAHKKLCYDVVS
jgi:transposase